MNKDKEINELLSKVATLEYEVERQEKIINEQGELINRIKEIVNKEITGIEAKLMIIDLLGEKE